MKLFSIVNRPEGQVPVAVGSGIVRFVRSDGRSVEMRCGRDGSIECYLRGGLHEHSLAIVPVTEKSISITIARRKSRRVNQPSHSNRGAK